MDSSCRQGLASFQCDRTVAIPGAGQPLAIFLGPSSSSPHEGYFWPDLMPTSRQGLLQLLAQGGPYPSTLSPS